NPRPPQRSPVGPALFRPAELRLNASGPAGAGLGRDEPGPTKSRDLGNAPPVGPALCRPAELRVNTSGRPGAIGGQESAVRPTFGEGNVSPVDCGVGLTASPHQIIRHLVRRVRLVR